MQLIAEIVLQRWILMMVRSFAILGSLTLVFWIWRPQWTKKFRIYQPREAKTLFWQELPRTIMGLSVYMIPVALLVILKIRFNYSVMYTDIADYGWVYFFLSLAIFAVFIDTWFYWAHRAMHEFKWLKKAHNVHHRSVNTNPVTSYSFDIVEALINMAPYMILVLFLPWHPSMIAIFAIAGTFYNGYIHLGYDFFFEKREKNIVTKWLYSSTHHSIHHQRYDGNYAVYFTFWDKLMKTEITK